MSQKKELIENIFVFMRIVKFLKLIVKLGGCLRYRSGNAVFGVIALPKHSVPSSTQIGHHDFSSIHVFFCQPVSSNSLKHEDLAAQLNPSFRSSD